MSIDLNFYPEKHLHELAGLTDIELPAGWTLAQLIEALDYAKIQLWSELLHVDEDGEIRWW